MEIELWPVMQIGDVIDDLSVLTQLLVFRNVQTKSPKMSFSVCPLIETIRNYIGFFLIISCLAGNVLLKFLKKKYFTQHI